MLMRKTSHRSRVPPVLGMMNSRVGTFIAHKPSQIICSSEVFYKQDFPQMPLHPKRYLFTNNAERLCALHFNPTCVSIMVTDLILLLVLAVTIAETHILN